MQIQISSKPTDLDLHCLQKQGIFGFSRTRVNTWEPVYKTVHYKTVSTGTVYKTVHYKMVSTGTCLFDGLGYKTV